MRDYITALAAMFIFAGIALSGCSDARASAQVNVSFQQAEDCEETARWEVFMVPGAAQPEPAATATPIATIQRSAATPCAGAQADIGRVAGVGRATFYMRAVAADGTVSGFSNPREATIPPARPILVNVEAVR